MKYDFHTIVIGAGSAGLVTAGILANLGAKVALIEKNKMGGDCLNTGCVPSKTLLYHGDKGFHSRKENSQKEEYFEEIMDKVHRTIEKIAPHDSKERFENMGVTVLKGRARLLDVHQVEISLIDAFINNGAKSPQAEAKEKKRIISGKYVVIATGSKPRVPKLDGLENISYLTNENLFSLKKPPKKLLIWGAGPISMEMGQAFQKLGSEVVIISRSHRLFKKDEPEVHPLMKEILETEGLHFYFGYDPLKIRVSDETAGKSKFNLIIRNRKTGEEKPLEGDQFLIALGRVPSTENLGLEKGGVKVDARGYVKVNQYLQTSNKSIYACGDVLGDYQFTHMAGYEAEIVARNLLSPIKTKADYSKVVWSTYTTPQVAHSGYTETSAKDAGQLGKALVKTFEEVDKNIIDKDTKGFVKLILNPRDRVIGGTVVSREAGEMIGMVSLAISKKMKVSSFQNLIYSYPTKSEIFKSLAVDNLQHSVKPWQRNLLKKWLTRCTKS